MQQRGLDARRLQIHQILRRLGETRIVQRNKGDQGIAQAVDAVPGEQRRRGGVRGGASAGVGGVGLGGSENGLQQGVQHLGEHLSGGEGHVAGVGHLVGPALPLVRRDGLQALERKNE